MIEKHWPVVPLGAFSFIRLLHTIILGLYFEFWREIFYWVELWYFDDNEYKEKRLKNNDFLKNSSIVTLRIRLSRAWKIQNKIFTYYMNFKFSYSFYYWISLFARKIKKSGNFKKEIVVLYPIFVHTLRGKTFTWQFFKKKGVGLIYKWVLFFRLKLTPTLIFFFWLNSSLAFVQSIC